MELKSVYLLKNIKKTCKDINNKLEGDLSLAISGYEDIFYEQSQCNTIIITTNKEKHLKMNTRFKYTYKTLFI